MCINAAKQMTSMKTYANMINENRLNNIIIVKSAKKIKETYESYKILYTH